MNITSLCLFAWTFFRNQGKSQKIQTLKKVHFSEKIEVHELSDSGYDRKENNFHVVTWDQMPMKQRVIGKLELELYKRFEMEIHPESQKM